jgi:hypothetical protein
MCRDSAVDEEMKNSKTHALISLLMLNLLRIAEADMPARGIHAMRRIGSLKVACVRSRSAL